MKKIILSLIALFGTMSMNAQVMKLYENGKLAMTLKNSSTSKYKVTFEKTEEAPSAAPEAVDLGLSVKWANMNVGATEVAGNKINSHTGQLDCYGEYYAWGGISPKDTYTWANLEHNNGTGSSGPYTKYVTKSNYGEIDGKSTLELADDAARANWGGAWRMPTKEEIQELIDNCYWDVTTNYNYTRVAGLIAYKAKDDADKGKRHYYYNVPTASYSLSDTHIFLPFGGCRDGNDFKWVNTNGDYWSSSLNSDWPNGAYRLMFEENYVGASSYSRNVGMNVRAVCP